jgi:hypothetical protein
VVQSLLCADADGAHKLRVDYNVNALAQAFL